MPKSLTKDLAELIGMLVGDGNIGIYKGKGYTHHEINFSGHKYDDFQYFDQHLNTIFRKLFNTELKIKNKNNQNTLIARIGSKGILQFFSEILELPTRNKTQKTRIPSYKICNK